MEVDISVSPNGDELRAIVARFEGELEEVVPSRFRDAEVDLRIRLYPDHKTAHGMVRLQRNAFQRGEVEHEADDPWGLKIWQRGVLISLGVYRPGVGDVAKATKTRDADDIPF